MTSDQSDFRNRAREAIYRLDEIADWRMRHTTECASRHAAIAREIQEMQVKIAGLQAKLVAAVSVAAFVATILAQVAIAWAKP